MTVPELAALARDWRGEAAQRRGVRIVAFGSSNTECSPALVGRFNWPEWLHSAMKGQVGRHVIVINAGISGETSADLLLRFDRDVVRFDPTAVIVTIGGNDVRRLPLETYGANLRTLVRRISETGAQPVLQTYYAVLDHAPPPPPELFPRFMEACRTVAAETAAPLIDIYAAMDPWYRADPSGYARIMRNEWHLNGLGCAVMGTLHARAWGLPDPPVSPEDQAEVSRCLETIAQHAAGLAGNA